MSFQNLDYSLKITLITGASLITIALLIFLYIKFLHHRNQIKINRLANLVNKAAILQEKQQKEEEFKNIEENETKNILKIPDSFYENYEKRVSLDDSQVRVRSPTAPVFPKILPVITVQEATPLNDQSGSRVAEPPQMTQKMTSIPSRKFNLDQNSVTSTPDRTLSPSRSTHSIKHLENFIDKKYATNVITRNSNLQIQQNYKNSSSITESAINFISSIQGRESNANANTNTYSKKLPDEILNNFQQNTVSNLPSDSESLNSSIFSLNTSTQSQSDEKSSPKSDSESESDDSDDADSADSDTNTTSTTKQTNQNKFNYYDSTSLNNTISIENSIASSTFKDVVRKSVKAAAKAKKAREKERVRLEQRRIRREEKRNPDLMSSSKRAVSEENLTPVPGLENLTLGTKIQPLNSRSRSISNSQEKIFFDPPDTLSPDGQTKSLDLHLSRNSISRKSIKSGVSETFFSCYSGSFESIVS